jgi:hypothetical protein
MVPPAMPDQGEKAMPETSLSELKRDCSDVLRRNPVLKAEGAFEAVLHRNALKRRATYRQTLAALLAIPAAKDRVARLVAVINAAFPGMPEDLQASSAVTSPAAAAPRPPGLDPYRSPALSLWMDGLARGLDWIGRGANPAVLDFSLAPELLEEDLLVEQNPKRRLGCGIGLIPAHALSASRMMSRRLSQCLPGLPGEEYPELREEALDRLAQHLNEAISLAREIDPVGHARLTASIHSFHVGLRRDPLCSFSSSNELPGSCFAVLSLARLADHDIGATAAQLLHETGHVLLGLHISSAITRLPEEPIYVSPYKNDLQALESILHMAYTIPWECAVRMALLERLTEQGQRARATAFVIAYAARQLPLTGIAEAGLERCRGEIGEELADIAEIPGWSAEILSLTERLLATESAARQAAHRREAAAVLARQAWDLGQMHLRGLAPIDPRVRAVSIAPDGRSLTIDYDGTTHRVVPAVYRATPKNYGAYAEESGAGIEPQELAS